MALTKQIDLGYGRHIATGTRVRVLDDANGDWTGTLVGGWPGTGIVSDGLPDGPERTRTKIDTFNIVERIRR